MKAKDDEIKRLSKERDKYQALVFARLRSSEALIGPTPDAKGRAAKLEHSDIESP